jgi:antitoxin (DNA-binding transcriptional repressor) of toxin-antitoxin stability system
MKVANLARVKDDLSRYVDYVRRGGRVRILVHGVPAAELVPVTIAEGSDDEAELRELERRGIVRRGTGKFPRELLRPGPRWGGKRLSEIVLEERKSGW